MLLQAISAHNEHLQKSSCPNVLLVFDLIHHLWAQVSVCALCGQAWMGHGHALWVSGPAWVEYGPVLWECVVDCYTVHYQMCSHVH